MEAGSIWAGATTWPPATGQASGQLLLHRLNATWRCWRRLRQPVLRSGRLCCCFAGDFLFQRSMARADCPEEHLDSQGLSVYEEQQQS